METANNANLAEGGKRLLDIIDRAPSDKRTLANMIAEAFINGMAAQERLATSGPARERLGRRDCRV